MAGLEASLRASLGWLSDPLHAEGESQVLLFSGETLRYGMSFWPGLETQLRPAVDTLLGWQRTIAAGQDLAASDVPIELPHAGMGEEFLGDAESPAAQPDAQPLTPHSFGFAGVGDYSADPKIALIEQGDDQISARRSSPMPLSLSEHREGMSAPAPMRGIDRPLDIGHLSGVAGADVIRFVDIFGRADGLAPAVAEAASSMAKSNHGTILTSDANLSGYVVARAWGADASPRGSVAEVAIDNALVDTGAGTDTELPAPHPLIDPWAETYVVLAPSVTDI